MMGSVSVQPAVRPAGQAAVCSPTALCWLSLAAISRLKARRARASRCVFCCLRDRCAKGKRYQESCRGGDACALHSFSSSELIYCVIDGQRWATQASPPIIHPSPAPTEQGRLIRRVLLYARTSSEPARIEPCAAGAGSELVRA